MTEEDLTKNKNNQLPDESQIEAMFAAFKPRPSDNFYKSMDSSPWRKVLNKRNPNLAARLSILSGWSALAAATAILLLIIAGTLATPSLRAVAQQIMYYFIPTQNDRLSVKVTVPCSSEATKFGSTTHFALTLPQVEDLAGYPVKQIRLLPPDFRFTGAHFDLALKSAALRYEGSQDTLYLTQRPLGEVEEYHSIAPSAPVKTIDVRGIQGEYVTGGWRGNPDEDERIANATPGTQVNLEIFWDPNLPQQTLRWQEDGISYELRFAGSPLLTQNELIVIAESIH